MRNLYFGLLFIILILFGCQQANTTKTESNDYKSNDPPYHNENDQEQETNSETPEQIEEDHEATDLDLLEVHYIDVGQADATLLTFVHEEENYTILFDAGDWQGNEVVPYLENEGVTAIDIAIISHPHADHIGQLENVLQNFPVDEVWMTGNTATTQVFQNTVKAIMDSDTNYVEPTAGDSLEIGPLKIDILHPDEQLTGDLNEDSLSALFTYGSTSFLFTGDAYKSSEEKMMEREQNIQATVLQLGHHGSNTSSGKAFIQAVQPQFGIYSAGIDNSYGHPHEEVVTLFKELDIPLYGTDKYGTIVVKSDGKTIAVSTEKEVEQLSRNDKDSSKEKDSENSQDKNHQEKSSDTSNAQCIDINSATIDELQKIIHIGPVHAEQLIQLRPFNSVENLTEISGIGPARLADILDENVACIK